MTEENEMSPLDSVANHGIDKKLCELVERIENLEDEKAELAASLKEVYTEAKCEGFDPKILRQVIKLRKMEQQEIDDQQNLLFLYMQALGMAVTSNK